jgi:hypothetical protein
MSSKDFLEWDLFISYSSKDKIIYINGKSFQIIDFIKKQLESLHHPSNMKKIKVCTDYEDFGIGGMVDNEILNVLKKSKACLVICSSNSKNSTWVRKEIDWFTSMGNNGKCQPLIGLNLGLFPHLAFPNHFNENKLEANIDLRQISSIRDLKKAIISECHRIAAGIWDIGVYRVYDRFKKNKRNIRATFAFVIITILALLCILLATNCSKKWQIAFELNKESPTYVYRPKIYNKYFEKGQFICKHDSEIEFVDYHKKQKAVLNQNKFIGDFCSNGTCIYYAYEKEVNKAIICFQDKTFIITPFLRAPVLFDDLDYQNGILAGSVGGDIFLTKTEANDRAAIKFLPRFKIEFHSDSIPMMLGREIALSPRAHYLANATFNGIIIYDLKTLNTMGMNGFVYNTKGQILPKYLRFSNSEDKLLWYDLGIIKMIDLVTMRVIDLKINIPHNLCDIEWDADKTIILFSSNEVVIYSEKGFQYLESETIRINDRAGLVSGFWDKDNKALFYMNGKGAVRCLKKAVCLFGIPLSHFLQ